MLIYLSLTGCSAGRHIWGKVYSCAVVMGFCLDAVEQESSSTSSIFRLTHCVGFILNNSCNVIRVEVVGILYSVILIRGEES